MGKSNQLTDVVARNAGLVLSFPSSSGLTHHKSKFLSEVATGVWVQAPESPEAIDLAMRAKTPIGVTFKRDNVRQVFASTLERFDPSYQLPDGAITQAVLISAPSEVKSVQRRNNYRAQILPDSGLTLDCWIITRHADLKDRPLPSQHVKLEVRDISLGGAGVILQSAPGKAAPLTFDDRLRVQVKLNGLELLVEGRVRTLDSASKGAIRTGIRFYFLDDGVDDRLKVSQLAKIIGQLELKQVKAIRKQAEALEMLAAPATELTTPAAA
jgi:c-di-GMP-binding flagellar brake protein YcgR